MREIPQPSFALAAGLDLRPTSDRLRETLFNVLGAGNPEAFEGKVWLDLCAGTGAVGIEALSRGASNVYFVESSTSAASLIRRNLDSLGVESGFEILKEDVARALPNWKRGTPRRTSSSSILPTAWRRSMLRSSSCSRNPAGGARHAVVIVSTTRDLIPATALRPCYAIASWSRGTRF